MERMWAIVERDLRRFRRSPMLIVMSLFMPLVQLVILGNAFGGQVKHLKVALVDQDHGVPALKIHELGLAVAANARTFDWVRFDDRGKALTALRNGRVNGVLTIPPGFSRRTLNGDRPRVALVEDNTDGFVAATLASTFGGMLEAYPGNGSRAGGPPSTMPQLAVVELYPYVPYIEYLLPGIAVMSIYMMVMIGGGIIFIDDKARGLHEGYLVTPVTRLELIMGFNLSGAIKAMLAGVMLVVLGSFVAGAPDPFAPMRMFKLLVVVAMTSVSLVSMMFLFMVRVSDPLLPRALFGVLNMLLWFPSGAIYPQQAFPAWMRAVAVADPFTYAVNAFKDVVLKNTGFGAIGLDLLVLLGFTVVTMAGATLLFQREL
jgi:ABC-2 type transport system permease protein